VRFRFRSGVETGAILAAVIAADAGLLIAAQPSQHWVTYVAVLVAALGGYGIFAAERREHVREVQERERDERAREQFQTLTEKFEEQRLLLQRKQATPKRAVILSPQLAEAALVLRDEIFAYLVDRAVSEPTVKPPPFANDPRYTEYLQKLARYEIATSWQGAKYVKRARLIAGFLNPRDSTLDGLVEGDLVPSKMLFFIADRLGVLAGVE